MVECASYWLLGSGCSVPDFYWLVPMKWVLIYVYVVFVHICVLFEQGWKVHWSIEVLCVLYTYMIRVPLSLIWDRVQDVSWCGVRLLMPIMTYRLKLSINCYDTLRLRCYREPVTVHKLDTVWYIVISSIRVSLTDPPIILYLKDEGRVVCLSCCVDHSRGW